MSDGTERLHKAINAALESAKEIGRLEEPARVKLEATLNALEERLGSSEGTRSNFNVEPVPDHCVISASGSAPVGVEVVASFMDGAQARRLASKTWLLPMGDLPATRWARALRRVISAERKGAPGLPIRLSMVWVHDGQMVFASVE